MLWAIAARAPKLKRLRYVSPHPRHLTGSLIRAHRELSLLARHVHLPVQSGSDAMLKRMIRRYSVAEYLERVAALRERVPGVTVSTDMIVGFPGETREDFEHTLSLVRTVRLSGLFGFKYSRRPETPALKLKGEPSEEEKSARLAELFELSQGIRREHLTALVGSEQQVLVEGPGKNGGFSGRTEQNEIVHFGASDDCTGQIVPARITQAFDNSLAAELVDETRRAPLVTARRALPVM